MALLIPVGYAQAVYELSLAGDSEPIVTTLGHDLDAWGSNYEDAANFLFLTFGTWVMPRVSNDYALQAVSLYVGQDGGPPVIYESTETSLQGGLSGAALPQNCAWLVRKRTSAAGRRGRGRMYIPGIAEANVNSAGVIDSGYVDTNQAAVDGWLDELLVPNSPNVAAPPVILHRSEGAGLEPPPTPVMTFEVDNVIATQRRRLRK